MNGKGDSSTGGAIIFITDGKHDCRHGGLDIDDKEVLDLIKDTKASLDGREPRPPLVPGKFLFVRCSAGRRRCGQQNAHGGLSTSKQQALATV